MIMILLLAGFVLAVKLETYLRLDGPISTDMGILQEYYYHTL
jgi:hypothetical protein